MVAFIGAFLLVAEETTMKNLSQVSSQIKVVKLRR